MPSAGERLTSVLGHLNPSSTGRNKLMQKNQDDIVRNITYSTIVSNQFQVITLAVRTPLTKAKKGGLKDTPLDDILIALLTVRDAPVPFLPDATDHMPQIVREKSNIDPNLVEDVCVGNVLAAGQAFIARSAVLAAGFPASTAASVANRFCSSGLLAVQNIANQIIAGSIDVGLAVGAESMSGTPDDGAPKMSNKILNHPVASQNLQPMGQTSENVAGQFSVTRQAMDSFAASSFQKAERAQKEGWVADEIVPITVQVKDPKTGEVREQVVDRDDGVRYGTTAESLGKIRAAFPQWSPSSTTGGNASQITDGAAAILLMKRSTAEKLGQPIVGKFCGATIVGLEPRIMGIGPSLAIPKILGKTGLSKDDVDVFEINEAFASMVSYIIKSPNLS
jgi:acetyl-CoA acyltransferase 1